MKVIISCLIFFTVMTASSKKPTYLIEKIEDGDTIIVMLQNTPQRIQLTGIDAPENTENAKLNVDIKIKKLPKDTLLKMGDLSTDFLKTLLKPGQTVTLEGKLDQKDKYGRIPAIVINKEGISTNEQMVKAGFAIILTRFPLEEKFKNRLEKAQQHAIMKNLGLWKSYPTITKKWSAIKK